jgi:hypothetical protein
MICPKSGLASQNSALSTSFHRALVTNSSRLQLPTHRTIIKAHNDKITAFAHTWHGRIESALEVSRTGPGWHLAVQQLQAHADPLFDYERLRQPTSMSHF